MRDHLNYREWSIVHNVLMHMNTALKVFSVISYNYIPRPEFYESLLLLANYFGEGVRVTGRLDTPVLFFLHSWAEGNI